MAYKLMITEHAEKLIERLVNHLLFQIQNEQAAIHLLDSINIIYGCLTKNPFQFPKSKNTYLAKKGYREALVPKMKYIIIFRVSEDCVYIMGVFHQLENYFEKL